MPRLRLAAACCTVLAALPAVASADPVFDVVKNVYAAYAKHQQIDAQSLASMKPFLTTSTASLIGWYVGLPKGRTSCFIDVDPFSHEQSGPITGPVTVTGKQGLETTWDVFVTIPVKMLGHTGTQYGSVSVTQQNKVDDVMALGSDNRPAYDASLVTLLKKMKAGPSCR